MALTNENGSGRGGTWLEHLGCMTLYPQPESVPCARRWFRKLTAEAGFSCSVDDCVVMLSELVTNAIVHGCMDDDARVRVVWWRQGNALRVDVHDPGALECFRDWRTAHDNDESGRGLQLVDALADRWEVAPSLFVGTRVSFVMDNAWKSGESAPQ